MSEELKSATLNLRIRPSVKELAERCAKADDRSVANWLERLIEADAARRGLMRPNKKSK
jgi:predicted HicB family RNase H-like nuclease